MKLNGYLSFTVETTEANYLEMTEFPLKPWFVDFKEKYCYE